jgi:2OG-Fe(II) oxygenase superfamily
LPPSKSPYAYGASCTHRTTSCLLVYPASDFTHALIAQYPPETQLGWHRDIPDFELVVGISLVGPCRMRFRRYPPRSREKSIALELEPRSIYRLQDEARWEWQHRIPPVPALRYSITFRTRRKQTKPRARRKKRECLEANRKWVVHQQPSTGNPGTISSTRPHHQRSLLRRRRSGDFGKSNSSLTYADFWS